MIWSKYQEDIFDAVLNTNKNIAISATAGSGKCLGIRTPVLMFNGTIKNVEDVVEGDLLMGDDSTSRKVLSTNVGFGKMYKITPVKGDSFICNDVHVLTLHKYIDGRSKNPIRKTPIIDIPLNEYLDEIKGVKLEEGGFSKAFKLIRTGVDFKKKLVAIDPYMIGLWLGDGDFDSPTISNIEPEVIEYIEKYVNNNFGDISVKKNFVAKNNCYSIDITGIHHSKKKNLFREEFNKCKKNYNKVIPFNYLINSRENRLRLLAGLLDSDGYLGNGYFEITTKYDGLKNDILFLARSLGFATYCKYKKSTIKKSGFEGWYNKITISGNVSEIPCLVKRKKANNRKQIKNVLRTGFKVEYVGKDKFYGFTLSGNGRFLLGDFTVTHNTTVIVESAKRLSEKYPYKSILFNAFNKSIVEELKKRLPATIECSTIHSLGMKALMRHYKTNLRVDEYKSFKLSDKVLKDLKIKGNRDSYKYTLSDVFNLSRMNLCGEDEKVLEELVDYYDISITNGEIKNSIELMKVAGDYNLKINKYNNMIDFTDMIHLPATNDKIVMKQYDVVMVDESQDMNEAQHKFLDKLIKPNGRLISVGDKFQSIYGFAGASSDSFKKFQEKENTITLPLSVCYRCAKSVVKNAQKINHEIQYFEGQKEGVVRHGEIDEIEGNDFVLCRNIRPLVELYFILLKNNKKVFIKGRDIEKGLIKIYEKVKLFDKFEAKSRLNEMLDKCLNELSLKGVSKPEEHVRYLNLKEKINIINIICDKVKYMYEVENNIKELFTDKKDAIILSTIHKAKGLEAERVFFLEKFNGKKLIPTKYATQDHELEQENNILFVALSRSKSELIYIKL